MTAERSSGLNVAMRGDERVSPLELFFDLVFVLAITQCTSLMATDPTFGGIGRALVVLGILWWSWVGYAWLTSVVAPDDPAARLVLFAAAGALLVCALAVPDAYGDLGLTLVVAYAVVRAAHIALFVLASRADAGLRRSVIGLAISTALVCSALIAGSFLHGNARLAVWAAALAFDMAGPLVIDTSGWRLVPGHFAERHGLIVIVALGESIVEIGLGAEHGLEAEVIVAAMLGMAIVAALWWVYFDVTAAVTAARLAEVEDIAERNEMARDSYSYLHLPMVAAIILVALGLRVTLSDVDTSLSWACTTALLGGCALYLAAHLAFKARMLGTFSVQRLVALVALLVFVPAADELSALATTAGAVVILWALVAFETFRYADVRREFRESDPSSRTGSD